MSASLERRAVTALGPPLHDIDEGPYWIAPSGTILGVGSGFGHGESADDLGMPVTTLIAAGFARVRSYGQGSGLAIQIHLPLTEAQRRVILGSSAAKDLATLGGEMSVDVENARGRTVYSDVRHDVTRFASAGILARANRVASGGSARIRSDTALRPAWCGRPR